MIIVGALIAVIVVGALAATIFMKPQDSVTAAQDKATKLAFYNNGDNWLHMNVVMENVTLKNGTTQTFYSELYLQPKNGTIVIDLSKLAGYGNEKLPAGTTIRILAWKGLLNSNAGGKGDLNLTMQGWSNTVKPQKEDSMFNVFFAGLPVAKLPNNVNTDMIWTDIDVNKLHQQMGFIDDGEVEPLFEEELVTVDQNGKVTITSLTAPELCRIIANIL